MVFFNILKIELILFSSNLLFKKRTTLYAPVQIKKHTSVEFQNFIKNFRGSLRDLLGVCLRFLRSL
jgi:hypothetical protein